MNFRRCAVGTLLLSISSPGWAETVSSSQVTPGPAAMDRAEKLEAPEARPFEIGLGLSAAPTLLTELYFTAQDRGLLSRGSRSWVHAGLAPLAGVSNTRVAFQRWEAILRARQQSLELLAGAQWSHGSDWASRYDTLGVLVGLRYGYTWGHHTLGAHLSYVLGISTWLHFSDAYRASYDQRYPDERDGAGPQRATVFFGSHRIEGALNYTFQTARWSLWSALGIQASPSAGPLWASLELGQLPLLLSCAGGYRF